MSFILVIVESPAKCKKIESYLGDNYKVIASYGHLRKITDLKSIDINNRFNTKYTNINEDIKQKQIEYIRKEISKATEVIIATDDDREGEAIGWHICDMFELPIELTKRIVFHEITKNAIDNAILHPKTINMNLVHAQQSRQILDLLVGFTISPILWNCVSKTHDSSLSAGRCQTPALQLVYDNYLDIKQGSHNIVYNTTGCFTSLNIIFELNKQWDNENKVKDFLEECKSWNYIYSITNPTKTIKKSPEPLTTSTLQQLASNELHLSPKETMKYAQQLYENGHITYMRTDSKKYSNEFINNVSSFIKNTYGDEYINPNINMFVVSNKEQELTKTKTNNNAQEAHEAIRPVNINNHYSKLQIGEHLYSTAIKLYELIWNRALESCMSSAQYNYINAKITAPYDSQFVYRAEQPVFLGWKIVVKNTDNNTNPNYIFLQTMKQNVSITPKQIDAKFTIIGIKSHYSEAMLVQLLEKKGIGRPSTFASLVDKLQERNYIKKQNISGEEVESVDFSLQNNHVMRTSCKRTFGKEQNKLVIQPVGIIVIEFLLENFSMFFNYEYTKQMEEGLDKISNGEHEWYDLCHQCHTELTNITNNCGHLLKFSVEIDPQHTLIIGKHGPVVKYVDPNDPKKVRFLAVKKTIDITSLANNSTKLTLEDIIVETNAEPEPIGKYKNCDLYVKNGKYGIYAQWGKEKKSLSELNISKIDDIQYIDVIRYLDKDNILDPNKPVGLIRELNKHLSIRTGKYGDYIMYKTPRMKKPQFYKLNQFKGDYKNMDKKSVMDWIKLTYKIE